MEKEERGPIHRTCTCTLLHCILSFPFFVTSFFDSLHELMSFSFSLLTRIFFFCFSIPYRDGGCLVILLEVDSLEGGPDGFSLILALDVDLGSLW